MLNIEYDYEEAKEYMIKEAKEEGMEKGMEKGIMSTLIGLVKKGLLTTAQAAEQANMTEPEFNKKAGLV